MLYCILKAIVGPFLWLFLRPIIYGAENLRIRGKAIIICNHRSMIDPIVLGLVTPRIIHFMAKKEIFEKPIGNLFYRGICAFPVNRKNVDLASLKSALGVLNRGKVFGIFPEGKRAVSDSLDEFEKGTAFLAIRSGAPIIPVYMHPDSSRRNRPVLIVGKAIDVSGIVANAKKSSMIEVVTDELADTVDALRLELEEKLCE